MPSRTWQCVNCGGAGILVLPGDDGNELRQVSCWECGGRGWFVVADIDPQEARDGIA